MLCLTRSMRIIRLKCGVMKGHGNLRKMGFKALEEVTEIIQRRAAIYVSEKSH